MIFFSWFLLPRGHLGRCKVLRWNLPLWVSLAWAGSSFSNHLSGVEQQSGKGWRTGRSAENGRKTPRKKAGACHNFFFFFFPSRYSSCSVLAFVLDQAFETTFLEAWGVPVDSTKWVCFSLAFFFSLFFFKADAFVDATQSSSFLPRWFNYIQKFVIRMFGMTDNENAV